jgi:hypothetical protein
MHTPRLQIYFSILMLLIGTSAGFSDSHGAESETGNKSVEQRVENRSENLEDIQACVEQQRQSIEDSYEFHARAVLDRKEDYLRRLRRSVAKLSQGDRRMLGWLLKVYADPPATDRNGVLDELLPIVEKYVSGPTAMDKAARKLLRDMAEFENELAYLQTRREASLQELARWEQEIREDAIETMNFIKRPAKEVDAGVIGAIIHDKERACVMIGGDIVYQGGTTNSVRVVKIHEDRVEFSKEGKTWVQKLGEPASAYWNQ